MAASNGLTFNLDYAYSSGASDIRALSTAFTCEFWYKPTADPPENHFHMIVADGKQSATYANFFILYKYDTKQIYFQMYDTAFRAIISNTTLTNGSWFHVAAIWDGSEMRLYINGVKQTTTFTISSHSTAYTENFYVGYHTDPTWNYKGYGVIDELRVSKTTRYTSNFTPSTDEFTSDANTLGLWHFNDNLTDSSSKGYNLTHSGTPGYQEGHVGTGEAPSTALVDLIGGMGFIPYPR